MQYTHWLAWWMTQTHGKMQADASLNTDKYYDLITLFWPPPLSLEENMLSANSESCE